MGLEFSQQLDAISESFSKTRSEAMNNVDLQKYPLTSEPALIHPDNSSVIKIRETGTIDIFVGTDNGIRINPNDKSITFLANTYGAKSMNRKEIVMRDSSQSIGGNWTVNVSGNINLSADGSISIKARKDIDIVSTEGKVNTK
jgi:hypothetical protein